MVACFEQHTCTTLESGCQEPLCAIGDCSLNRSCSGVKWPTGVVEQALHAFIQACAFDTMITFQFAFIAHSAATPHNAS